MENVIKNENGGPVKYVNKDVWLDYSVSSKLLGNELQAEFKEKLDELTAIANRMAPEGRLVISLSTKDEKFSDLDVLSSNAVIAKKLFTSKSIMANPLMAIEFGELLLSIKGFNVLMGKRKDKDRKRRLEYKNNKNNQK